MSHKTTNSRLFRAAAWLLVALLASSCGGKSTQIRNLSSDVCLVMPDSTTRQEVLSFLGEPDRKMSRGDNLEMWLYLDVKKSFSRKMPLVGDNLGRETYESVTVTFEADLVRACFYRQFDEKEFADFSKDLGIE